MKSKGAKIFEPKYTRDINLLAARVKSAPDLHRDKVQEKLKEFFTQSPKVKGSPQGAHLDFCNNTYFLAQVSEALGKKTNNSIKENLIDLLRATSDRLAGTVRLRLIQSLLIIEKKQKGGLVPRLPFFFSLLGLSDKRVRSAVFGSLFHALKARRKANSLDLGAFAALLRRFLKTATSDIRKRVAKLLIKLYDKHIWRDRRLVNILADCVQPTDLSSSFIVTRWLLASTEGFEVPENSEDEDETLEEVSQRLSRQYKSSKKKIEKMAKQLKNLKRKKRRQAKQEARLGVYPIDQLYSPAKFAERVLRILQTQKRAKWALKIETLCLIGRLVHRRNIILPSFLNLALRYLKPTGQDAARLLAFVCESVHEQTPLEELTRLGKHIIDHFANEGQRDVTIVMGLNAAREIFLRNQTAFGAEEINFLCSLRDYKDRNVNTSCKSFINAVRDLLPDLLEKRFQQSYVAQTEEAFEKALFRDHRSAIKESRIDGIELLGEGEAVIGDRLLTNKDFKKIQKLKKEQIMEMLRKKAGKWYQAEEESRNNRIDFLELRKKVDMFEKGLLKTEDIEKDLILQRVLIGQTLDQAIEGANEERKLQKMIEEESSDEESDYSVHEESEDEDQIKFEIEEETDNLPSNNPTTNHTTENNESDSESDVSIEEEEEDEPMNFEQEMRRRGFVPKAYIDTYKHKRRIHNKKELKGVSHFEEIASKKFGNRKKAKAGSKTNREKQKNQPMLMVVEKMARLKGQINRATKRIKKKQFMGRIGRFGFKNKKSKKRI